MKRTVILISLLVMGLALAACGGEAEPTPTKTPRPTATDTPLPTVAVALPAVEANQPAQATPTVAVAPVEPNSPIAPPTDTPTPQPTPTPAPGIEALPPVPVLAGTLDCAAGCEADTPNAIGLALLNLESGQVNIWARDLPLLGDQQEYAGWMQDGESVESMNSFDAEEDGTAGDFVVLLPEEAGRPWTSYFVTIEPEETTQGSDQQTTPSGPRSISGPLRTTVMGEALYGRYNMPCRQCHGPTAGGDLGPALAAPALAFDDFLAAVRSHAQPIDQTVASDRDLRHIYAWLKTISP